MSVSSLNSIILSLSEKINRLVSEKKRLLSEKARYDKSYLDYITRSSKSKSLSDIKIYTDSALSLQEKSSILSKKIAETDKEISKNEKLIIEKKSELSKQINIESEREMRKNESINKKQRLDNEKAYNEALKTHKKIEAISKEISNMPIPHELKKVLPPVKEKLRILFITSNTDKKQDLKVDDEISIIYESIRKGNYRDNIETNFIPSITFTRFMQGLNDFRPHILHFSGHSSKSYMSFSSGIDSDIDIRSLENRRGIVYALKNMFKSEEDETIEYIENTKEINNENEEEYNMEYERFSRFLSSTDSPPKLVVMNSCNSLYGHEIILNSVPSIIGMSSSISDGGAICFSKTFYGAIASGQSLYSSFNQATLMMDTNGFIKDSKLPQVKFRDGIDIQNLKFIEV